MLSWWKMDEETIHFQIALCLFNVFCLSFGLFNTEKQKCGIIWVWSQWKEVTNTRSNLTTHRSTAWYFHCFVCVWIEQLDIDLFYTSFSLNLHVDNLTYWTYIYRPRWKHSDDNLDFTVTRIKFGTLWEIYWHSGLQAQFVTSSRPTTWFVPYIKILPVYSELSVLIKPSESARLRRKGIEQTPWRFGKRITLDWMLRHIKTTEGFLCVSACLSFLIRCGKTQQPSYNTV